MGLLDIFRLFYFCAKRKARMVNLLLIQYSLAKSDGKNPGPREVQGGESICLLRDHWHIPQVDQMYCGIR